MTEEEIWEDYQQAMLEESQREEANTIKVLNEVAEIVTPEYLEAIQQWLDDVDNGIYGGLKITDKPIGEWQDESSDYWDTLKGMYVNQSCGYTGDDYHGTLEIKLTEIEFLRAFFSL